MAGRCRSAWAALLHSRFPRHVEPCRMSLCGVTKRSANSAAEQEFCSQSSSFLLLLSFLIVFVLHVRLSSPVDSAAVFAQVATKAGPRRAGTAHQGRFVNDEQLRFLLFVQPWAGF